MFSDTPDDDDSGDESWDHDADSSSDEPMGATHVFFENEPLIRALNDPGRSENDPDAAKRLFRGLLDATLIALIPEDTVLDIDENGQISSDVQLGFLTVRHESITGDIIPMFTDEGALGAFTSEGGRYVALSVRDLFPLLAAGGLPPNVVVNPGGGEALLLTPTMVLDVVQSIRGYRPISVRSGADVSVSPPEHVVPSESRGAFTDVFSQFAEVIACWHFAWHIEGVHDDPTSVLAIEFDDDLNDDERRALFEAIQDGVEPLVESFGESVDLVDFHRHTELFAEIASRIEPLYSRPETQA